jgi:FixJ family two-component response regulator
MGTDRSLATVYVVDDDHAVRSSFQTLMRAVGLKVETFARAADYLKATISHPGCLVLDVRMPEMDGVELRMRIGGTDRELPVIFITGEENEELRLRMLEAGAMAFLYKPFDDDTLLEAVLQAIERDS